MENSNLEQLNDFLESWIATGQEMAKIYQDLYQEVVALDDTSFTFTGRPGVSFSLRPVHANQSERKFFAIMDVIDDEPDDRWLSICFYGDMITDPEERGELVPGGLGGADGYCFDMYAPDSEMTTYLKDRLLEAWQSAK